MRTYLVICENCSHREQVSVSYPQMLSCSACQSTSVNYHEVELCTRCGKNPKAWGKRLCRDCLPSLHLPKQSSTQKTSPSPQLPTTRSPVRVSASAAAAAKTSIASSSSRKGSGKCGTSTAPAVKKRKVKSTTSKSVLQTTTTGCTPTRKSST